ncbi:MAG: glycosyltransferase family 9 protein [Chlamydiia bacterium]|nr:glycosyltransferase family 9 protein [Chlamydiia bacterium]
MRANKWLHFFDRYGGIPLLWALGLLRRKKKLSAPIASFGLLNTAAIGDTILITGVIADLQEQFPEAKITFFVGPSNVEAAQLIAGIEVVQIQVTKLWQAIRIIRHHRVDVWLDFGQWPRINGLFSYFAKARFKVGFQTPNQYRHYIYDQAIPHRYCHELENFRSLLCPLGIVGSHAPKIVLPQREKSDVKLALHLNPGGSQAHLKRWPESHWVALIDAVTKQGLQVFLTGGKGDWPLCERVKKQCAQPEQIAIVAGQLSLRETGELLLSCVALVTVDTGIMHLGAAVGCKTLALHGPSSAKRWGGVGSHVIPITPKKGYSPCLSLGFEKGCTQSHCMEAIEPSQVMQVLFEEIEKEKTKKRPLSANRGWLHPIHR